MKFWKIEERYKKFKRDKLGMNRQIVTSEMNYVIIVGVTQAPLVASVVVVVH